MHSLRFSFFVLPLFASTLAAQVVKSDGPKPQVEVATVRVDTNGTKAWDKSFGGSTLDEARRVLQLSDGGFMIAGNSDSGISGNKTNASYGGSDYWLIRLDADGLE